MLICCPKCHSIYEIPDNLIKKTGQNFRCQACANVWHAMREDALGYTDKEETPYIEAIDVSVPPNRNYPANKDVYSVPADTKSGKKTISSVELIKKEGNPENIPQISHKIDDEIKLTSDTGTSFTIRAIGDTSEEDTKHPPYLYPPLADGLTISADDRLLPEKPFKGYKKTYALLFLIALCAVTLFFRREVTALLPVAETYYNQINLSGINNPEYLKFKDISIIKETLDNKPYLKVTATVYNNSFYTTTVPAVNINGAKSPVAPNKRLLKGYEQTIVEGTVPLNSDNNTQNITLSFQK